MSGRTRPVIRLERVYDVTQATELPGTHLVAARVVVPAEPAIPVVLCCTPGGGMGRDYFDLLLPCAGGGYQDKSYSFAEYAVAAGLIVVTVDNLGTGRSISDAAPRLSAISVAAANAAAFESALGDLRAGTLDPRIRPIVEPVSIGIGHSMGAMLTVFAQHVTHAHAGLAVLGFTTAGLPQLLSERELAFASTPARFGNEIIDTAIAFQNEAASRRGRGSPFPFRLDDTPVAAARALASHAAPPLPGPALLSMLPHNVSEAAAAIDVPVFLGVGDHEPWADAETLAGQFRSSPAVRVHVLARAAHNHVLAGTRAEQWEALCGWAADVGAHEFGWPATLRLQEQGEI